MKYFTQPHEPRREDYEPILTAKVEVSDDAEILIDALSKYVDKDILDNYYMYKIDTPFKATKLEFEYGSIYNEERSKLFIHAVGKAVLDDEKFAQAYQKYKENLAGWEKEQKALKKEKDDHRYALFLEMKEEFKDRETKK